MLPIKQKHCLAYLLKKQYTFILDNIRILAKKKTIYIYSWQYGSTYNMSDGPNEKKMSSCLKNQTEKTTVVEWNEDMII